MKKRILSSFIACCILLAACNPLADGVRLAKDHKYREAVDFYSEKISEKKYLLPSFCSRAYCHMYLEEFDKAEVDFDSCISYLKLFVAEPYLNNAICCMFLGKPAKAKKLVDLVLSKDKANAPAAMLRGMLYIYYEKYHDALLDIHFARKYTGYQGYKFCDPLCYRYYAAAAYERQGKLNDAVEELFYLIKKDKKYEPDAYYFIGNFYARSGKQNEADNYYKLCIYASPPSNYFSIKSKIRLNYPGDSLAFAGIPADSIVMNDTVSYIHKPDRMYNLATIYAIRQDHEKAITLLAEAFQNNAFGLTAVRLDYDLDMLGKIYDLNKLYLSHGKEIALLPSNEKTPR